MRILLTIFAFLVLVSAGTISEYRQVDYDTNAKMKAIYLYNFAKYIEWPAKYKDDKFVIGVIGNNHLEKELKALAATRKRYNETIVVKHIEDPSDIGDYELVYVGKEKTSLIPEVVKATKKYSTLIVIDKPGSIAAGAGISFVVVNNKVRFEISKKNTGDKELIVSSNLINLAVHVE